MLSRRALMGTAAATFAAAATLAVSPRARAAGDLRVLNWQGYGTDEAWALEAFKKKTGINVVHDYFNSEQEMLTKLRTSPGAYDVVLINSTYTQQAGEEGLIQPIDTAQLRRTVGTERRPRDTRSPTPPARHDDAAAVAAVAAGCATFHSATSISSTRPAFRSARTGRRPGRSS